MLRICTAMRRDVIFAVMAATGVSGPFQRTPQGFCPLVFACIAFGVAATAHADGTAADVIDEIVVFGERPSLTNDPTELSRARLNEIAGATGVVGPDERFGEANLSITDAIGGTPGVIAQAFFGGNDQPRIQMRGSGLQQNPTQRGVLLLQDGLPLSRADGSYIVASLEPDASNTIEIYRGAAGARVGAATLGGAVNFISLTGRDVQDTRIAVEGGSFGTVTGRLTYGTESGPFDVRGTVVTAERDGFREPFNDSDRTAMLINTGYRFSENLETRFYIDYVDLGFDIPGPITSDALENEPESVHPGPIVTPNPGGMPPFLISGAGPNVPRDQPRRDAEKLRFSARATHLSGVDELDFGVTYADTDEAFRFPVSAGVRATEGHDIAVDARYTRYAPGDAIVPLIELSAHYISGEHDRTYNHNEFGEIGDLFSDNELAADTLSLNAYATLLLSDRWRLTGGLNYVHATRDNDDVYGLPTRPTLRVGGPPPGPILPAVPAADTSFSRDYSGLNPSLSLSYAWRPRNIAFVSLARSYEPPSFEDLFVTSGGTPNSGPLGFITNDLDAQSAYTLELGARGDNERFGWDVVVYRAWVEDELLSLRDATGVPLGTRNADETRRTGVEVGLSATLTEWLRASVAYTYQDFTFDDDPFFGNNKLAGAQPQTVDARLTLEPIEGLSVTPLITWTPEDTPVDNANTVFRDDYLLLGLQARYRMRSGSMTIFIDARNLTDERFASSNLVTDIANPTQAAFLPGDGRAAYAGIELRF